MAWPILTPAPVVSDHAAVVRRLFDNQCQVRHFQHSLTGLIVWPHKSLANRARGLLDSADKTTLSRFLSEAPWREEAINRRRLRVRRPPTKPQRRRRRGSRVVLEDTLCEPVGRLFDSVDRHDNHGDGTSPLAHHPVTSVSVRGPGRFPLERRLSRRDEARSPWEAAVAQHFPALKIPIAKKARHRLQTPVAPVWLQDPDCRARHEQFRTTLARAMELVEAAIRDQGPCGVVVCEAWSLAEDLVRGLARRRKDWSSLRKKNRRRETASVHRREANGWALKRPGPHIAVEALVPRIPAQAYRPGPVSEDPSGGFPLAVRIPGLGKVRLGVSCEHESWTGRAGGLVTKRVDWSAAKIISLDGQRWPTATFYQDRKGPWGLNA